MIVDSLAIVIHSLRYGEADLIVKLFTKESGVRSYLLKGILKSKKGKMKSSFFQPLTLLEIEAVHKNKGGLERINEAKVFTPLWTLHTDVVKGSIVFFVAEILNIVIHEEEANEDLYEYLETMILWLDAHDNVANFHVVFLIKLTQYLGFYPDVSTIECLYFNPEEGCFQDKKTTMYCAKGEIVELFKQFLGVTFEEGICVKMSKVLRSQVVDLILVYFELHLQEFKKPKSLAILNEIFN